jgi:mannose-6-phosphate isomerase-like protein (cupin superfamily)
MATAVQEATTAKPRKPQIFKYEKPESDAGKTIVNLGTSGLIRGAVQVVKKGAGDNNLHIHTGMDGIWMVLKGEVTFYGEGDEIIGVFGPNEGIVMPHGNAYWFASTGDVDLEILQMVTWAPDVEDKRVDLTEQKEKVGPGKGNYFDARVRG